MDVQIPNVEGGGILERIVFLPWGSSPAIALLVLLIDDQLAVLFSEMIPSLNNALG